MRNLKISAFTLCSSLGRGVQEHLDALTEKSGGLRPADFPGADLQTWIGRVAGIENVEIPGTLRDYDCRNNRLAQMAVDTDGFSEHVAAAVARHGATRIGLFIGTSTSGVQEAERAYANRDPDTDALPRNFRYDTTQNIFSVGGFARKILGLRGPAEVISTACSSSAKAFTAAHRFMSAGFCDAAIVGGVDSLCLMTIYGFNSLQLVSDEPCRPDDRDRSGLSIGEAAGFALLEWEDADTDLSLIGFGESSDAYHMSTPRPDGAGAVAAIRAALTRAELDPEDIDYINLHGTGTAVNDLAEDTAVYGVFGDRVPCSSTKGFTGHTLGAAGIVEALLACLAIQNDVAFASLNTRQLDPDIRSNVLLDTLELPVRHVMSNSFGFGGSNASLIFGGAK